MPIELRLLSVGLAWAYLINVNERGCDTLAKLGNRKPARLTRAGSQMFDGPRDF
jgi:hypothetical protein